MANGTGKSTDSFSVVAGGTDIWPGNGIGDAEAGNGDSVGSNTGAVDPAVARSNADSGPEYTGGTNKDGSPTKKRGRKAGTKASSGPNYSQAVAPDLGALSSLLLSLHKMIAVKIPEMELEKAEADLLAEGVARVERHYPVVSGILTGKVADHVALATALATVYGTRIAAIKMRRDAERATVVNPAQPPQNNTATVHPFHPNVG